MRAPAYARAYARACACNQRVLENTKFKREYHENERDTHATKCERQSEKAVDEAREINARLFLGLQSSR